MLFLSIIACAPEYAINAEKNVPASVNVEDTGSVNVNTVEDDSGVPTTPEETGDTAAVTTEDSGLEPDGDCGFHVNNGMEDEAFVESYPTFQLLSPAVSSITARDSLSLSFKVTANPCGDVELLVMQVAVVDDVNFDAWLDQTEVMVVSDDAGYLINDTAPNGVGPGYELGFTWSDGFWELGYDNTGYMDTMLIPAGTSLTVTFEFPDTNTAPVGTIADELLSVLIWRDVGTDQEVDSFNDGHEDMWSEYEFVE